MPPPARVTLLAGAIAVMTALAGCASSADGARPAAGPRLSGRRDERTVVRSLRDVYEPYFAIGAAVEPQTLVTHREILTRHMASLTAENHMKLHMVRPFRGTTSYAGADAIVSFAEEHGMQVRGHTLLWHEAAPDWFFEDDSGRPAAAGTVRERLREHIAAIVARYRGRVYAWDVVNEAVSDSSGTGILRETRWLETLGPSYLADAFHAAHEADPDALLFYNDYSLVEPGKRARTVELLRGLIADGVPVHGVGMQGHWTMTWPPVDLIDQAISAYSELGLRVEITELDVSFYDWNDHSTRFDSFTPGMDEALARRYGEIFAVLREHADAIDAVTFWGAADDVSWLNYIPVRGRPNYPLLFDRDHQPKAAFFAVTVF